MPVQHNLPATEETVRVGVIDQAFPPVLSVDSGDTVSVETWNAWGNSITPQTTMDDVMELLDKFSEVGPHDLTGPIEIRGAKPSQVLRVDILKLVPRTHGFNIILPGEVGAGLLPERFPNGEIRHYELDLETMTTAFASGVQLPLRPFLGTMGVAPKEPGPHHSRPPRNFGGNIDVADLVEGTTLYLPVWVDGALFYLGDAHGCQGDGEVNLTALEISMEEALVRLTILDGPSIPRPRAETHDYWITMAFHDDLHEAARLATGDMIDLILANGRMSESDAYTLCSLAMDLSVTQLVNQAMGVHATLPKAYLPAG